MSTLRLYVIQVLPVINKQHFLDDNFLKSHYSYFKCIFSETGWLFFNYFIAETFTKAINDRETDISHNCVRINFLNLSKFENSLKFLGKIFYHSLKQRVQSI